MDNNRDEVDMWYWPGYDATHQRNRRLLKIAVIFMSRRCKSNST